MSIASTDAPAASLPPPRQRLRRGQSSTDAGGTTTYRPCAEHTRERAALRHLHAWISLHQPGAIHRNAFPTSSADDGRREAPPPPEPSNDAALTAFAQLCCYRLGVRRALVTLLSHAREYVLTEATQTMSLQYDVVEDPRDKLWLGTCSYPRSCGISTMTVDAWRKARHVRDPPERADHYYTEGVSGHAFVVSDVRSNPRYQDVYLAQRAQWLRFYCAVPIRNLDGTVIGSLCALDDKPRYGLSLNDLIIMEDVADNVAEHLESCIVRSQRQRGEHLIQALSLFNSNHGSLREWWLKQDDERIRRGGRHEKTVVEHESQQERANGEFGVQDPELSDSTVSSRRLMRRDASDDSTADREPLSVTSDQDTTQARILSQGVEAVDFDRRPVGNPRETPRFAGEEQDSTPAAEQTRRRVETQTSTSVDKQQKQSDGFDLSSANKDAYARATNLIREALHAEAVVCVDSKAASSKITKRGPDGMQSDAIEITSEASNSRTSDTESDSGSAGSRICKVNGFSTRNRSSLTGTRADRQRFALTEKGLQALIKRHPQGKIFNFEEDGNMYSSSGDESTSASNDGTLGSQRVPGKSKHSREAQRLGKIMVGARSIAFFPIWDDTNENWRSCIFVWSTTPMRFFDPVEDMTYIVAFAHSLLAELARAETIASDRAKANFISSVSHELRSPLHGVLAGIEFMQDSSLPPFAAEMSINVAVAGRTLLDTINNILDYSKISSLTKAQRKEQAAAAASRHQAKLQDTSVAQCNEMIVDLCRLTEEVTQSTVSGHTYLEMSKSGLAVKSRPAHTRSRSKVGQSFTKLTSLGVTLNIQHRDSWGVNVSPGHWTRILANLLGNALKYTEEGMINVDLSAEQSTSDGEPDRALITLAIRDTGIGMSQDFLTGDLYTPFKQADSHSTGTGLGLSIVKRIVKDLDADLHIESELGKGTSATVRFRAKFDGGSSSQDLTDEFIDASASDIRGRHVMMLLPPSPAGTASSRMDNALKNSVLRTATDWFGCTTSVSEKLEGEPKLTTVTMFESHLVSLVRERSDLLNPMLSQIAARGMQLIILGGSISTAVMSFEGFPVRPVVVTQPIGPRKLLRALHGTEDVTKPRSLRDGSSHHTSSPRTPLVFRAGTPSTGYAAHEGDSFPWDSVKTAKTDKPRQNSTSGITFKATTPLPSPVPARPSLVKTGSSGMIPKVLAEVPSNTSSLHPRASSNLSNAVEADGGGLGSTALLVDDNGLNMKILVALMKKLKLPYKCADNGQEALDAYSTNPAEFFLVLMDIGMPVMNGNMSSAKIRELEHRHKLKRTFILALTGVTSAEARQEALNSGMDEFYTKPIRMKDLSDLVAKIREKEDAREN